MGWGVGQNPRERGTMHPGQRAATPLDCTGGHGEAKVRAGEGCSGDSEAGWRALLELREKSCDETLGQPGTLPLVWASPTHARCWGWGLEST